MIGRNIALALCLAAICMGIVFRFSLIDRKIYGYDETVTSVRVAGKTLADYDRAVREDRFHTIGDMRAFLHPQGSNVSGFSAILASLIAEDPQHPPLYYFAERSWQNVFGNSITARRMLAVLAGVLLIPAIGLLAWELFGSFATAITASALVAVSPMQLLYAQTAREYSLWSLLTVLASIMLVRATRSTEWRSWAWYGVFVVSGLYTFPFFACIFPAHAMYAYCTHGNRMFYERFIPIVMGALLLFSPWIFMLCVHRDIIGATTTWLSIGLPLRLLMTKWAFSVSAVFFDLEYTNGRLLPIAAACVLLAIAAFAVIALRAERRTTYFIVLLAVSNAAILILPDLFFHQSRSTAPRYLMETWIALDIATAFLVSARPLMLATVLAAGIFSCAHDLSLRVWWPNIGEASLAWGMPIIERAHMPILLIGPTYYALEAANVLPDDIRTARTAHSGEDAFLFALPSDLKEMHFAGGHYEEVPSSAQEETGETVSARSSLSQARTGNAVPNGNLRLYRAVPDSARSLTPEHGRT